jgi:uncharacterized protein (DUF488 family)
MQDTVFTIGHSNHSPEHFVDLLRRHGITALCDVRSKPHSRMWPQFNREEIEQTLSSSGVEYRFLGKELGGRSGLPYEQVAETELFRHGLKRLQVGVRQNLRIAIMCAEKEPLDCHRTILVARHLTALGVNVEHIGADGELETHSDALARLLDILHLPEQDLFHTPAEMLAEAYRLQEERIAYQPALEVKSAAG